MLSICIPTYNVDITKLVNDLHEQIGGLSVPAEIVIVDDGSDPTKIVTDTATLMQKGTYIGLPENVGRARIRNMFLKYAKYPYLLFLDCDSGIVSKQFLAGYVAEIHKQEKVVCGGRIYSDNSPGRQYRLHWKYGKQKESKPAAIRQQNPNASFMTNNFLIERSLFEEIKLNEDIQGYGHEDTLFGYELKKKGISIKHIDNPVLHVYCNSNIVFMWHTESAIKNLVMLAKQLNYADDFVSDITLLRTYVKLKKSGFLFIVSSIYYTKRPFMRMLLCSGFASMFYFNFYKLGYYARTAATQ